MFRFLLRLLPVIAAVVPIVELHSQTPGPTADQLKSWVTIRKQRVDLLRDEMKQTDARIESRLDSIIGALMTIDDSKDSRTKVARMKEDTMKRLMKTIEYYDQKRAAMIQDARTPQTHLTAEERSKAIAIFDARIQKRTQQILSLNKSMPGSKDYDRYKATGGGWSGMEYERNKDFEQNRRMTTHSNTQRDTLIKQLDISIGRLDRMGRTLRAQAGAAPSKELTAEIARNDALIAERRKQRGEVYEPSDSAQRGVALKEAMDLDAALKKATDDLRREFTTLFQRYNTFVTELSTLHQTEAALAAAQPRR